MKKTFSLGMFRFPLLFLVAVLPWQSSPAAKLKQARISQVIHDVKLLPEQAAPRPAQVSDSVRDGTAVRTGDESRAELTFTDAILARLGANTIFSFNEGTRNLELGGGAMLLRVPKNAGGAQINTAAVTAAITGTTIMLEFHPNAYIKFIVLEGTGRIFRNNKIGESVLVKAGQMLIVNPNGKGLPDPVDVDLDRLIKTSLLINGFGPLPSTDLIAREINQQSTKKNDGGLIDTNLVIFGGGTTVALLDPTNSDVLDQANANETRMETPTPTATATPSVTPTPTSTPTPTATVTPTPSASVTPTITPTPSPSVTVTPTPTATVTPTPDKFGTPSVIVSSTPYQIGSGTAIVTDPAITTNGKTDFGKIYRSAELDGTPSTYLFGSTSNFDTSSGFDEHFSDPASLPMAVFKFDAFSLTGDPSIVIGEGAPTALALISVGDITSGSTAATLTFAGLDSLLLATQNGSITLNAALTIQDIPALFVYARGSESTLTFDSTVTGTTDLVLLSENNIQFNNALTVAESGLDASDGLILYFQAGNELTATNGLSLTLDNVSGDLGGSASINLITGGDFTASTLNLLINNRDGGSISGDAFLALNVGGALTTSGDAVLTVSSRDDGGGRGTLGGIGFISLDAGSVSIGGDFTLGMTPGNASAAFNLANITGTFLTQGSALFSLENGGTTEIGPTAGGVIDSDLALSFTAGNVSSGGSLSALLTNLNGGQLGGSASLGFSVSGALTIETDGLWQVINTSSGAFAGSTIGGDATLGVVAGDVSASSLFAQILNSGGSTIGGDAALGFGAAGDISTGGDATFRIVNFDNGTGAGTIDGSAAITVAARSLTADTLLLRINNLSGTIGGDSSLDLGLSEALTTGGDATFDILDGMLVGQGTIAGVSSIDVVVDSITVGGSLVAQILDGDTPADFDNVNLSATNDITVSDQILIEGNLSAGGNISAVNGITIGGGSIDAGGDLTSSAGVISQDFSVDQAGDITAGGDIFAAGGLFATGDPTVVTAGGAITAPAIIAGAVVAGGDVTIDNSDGLFSYALAVNSLTTPGALVLINAPSITPDNGSSDGSIGITFVDFSLTIGSFLTSGPTFPLLSSNGFAAVSGSDNDNPGNGGNITIDITAGGLTIGSTNELTGIQADGGMFLSSSSAGGDGGTIDITATDNIVLADGDISVTTGAFPTATPGTLGAGGTVNLTTSASIEVDSTIEVSSDVQEGSPVRRSASGGNISLTSTKATAGAAIVLASSGQLLSLLDSAAPGPGGQIALLASGAGGNSIDLDGSIQADRGLIDIRHTGDSGLVNLSDASGSNFAFIHGDVVKVGALGSNGVLSIGQGFISADDTLKLYGASADGEVRFVDDVTIGGQNLTIIAANTVTINDGRTVTVNGATADVYADFNGQTFNANYTGFGGNGSTTGTFAGAGANNPQPIENAPPFDDVAEERPVTNSTAANAPGSQRVHTRQRPVFHVTDTDQLLALAENVTTGQTNPASGRPDRGTNGPRANAPAEAYGRPGKPAAPSFDPTLNRLRPHVSRPAAAP